MSDSHSKQKHPKHNGNDKDYGQRSNYIATKHQTNNINDRISWIMTTGKSEAGDQSETQTLSP